MSELLTDDAQRGARLVALELLERIRAAQARLADPADAAALHDFRVAVRRLRSWLRVEDGLPRPMVPAKVHRWLRRLAHSTSPGRDDEVFAAWLLTLAPTLPRRQRPALRWLQERVTQHRALAEGDLALEIARDLERIESLLEARLRRYDSPMDVSRGSLEEPFGAMLAGRIRAGTAIVARRLQQIRDLHDAEAVHRARIAGKRLRYHLEPVEGLVPGVREVIQRFKQLQDVLGDHHDAHVWGQRVHAALAEAPTPAIRDGLRALLARIEQYGAERFAAYEALRGAGSVLPHAELAVIAAALEAAGGAGVEVERKYLLSGRPPRMPRGRVQRLEQGYLPGERLVERLRRIRTGQSVSHVRTVKVGSGIRRLEVEEECSAELFATLWPLTKGKRVRKRRYLVRDGTQTWAIDVFTDRALVLAEIELPSVEHEVTLPEWLSEVLVREVTDDAQYVNAVLAQ